MGRLRLAVAGDADAILYWVSVKLTIGLGDCFHEFPCFCTLVLLLQAVAVKATGARSADRLGYQQQHGSVQWLSICSCKT